jgi:sigma-B regulation protein RsbU (phosphoserine phosphatase)
MTTARAFLRMRAAQPGGISEIVSEMNRHLAKDVIETGWIIAMGTDGVWETRNHQGTFFGKDRLKKINRDYKNGSAHDILEAVYRDLASFSQGVKSEDDATLVVIKIKCE